VRQVSVVGMNHAVLYVRDARRTAEFYERVLDFVRIIDDPQGRFIFMRAPLSRNHHDIAFFTVGEQAGPSRAGQDVGMYHLAWEVPSLDDLVEMERKLSAAGVLVGKSDHGANKSLYSKDPDGLEFEVMWLVPAEQWGDEEHQAIIRPLDLGAEQRRQEALTARP
jgi:catechol-2,3-dioxygenase